MTHSAISYKGYLRKWANVHILLFIKYNDHFCVKVVQWPNWIRLASSMIIDEFALLRLPKMLWTLHSIDFSLIRETWRRVSWLEFEFETHSRNPKFLLGAPTVLGTCRPACARSRVSLASYACQRGRVGFLPGHTRRPIRLKVIRCRLTYFCFSTTTVPVRHNNTHASSGV
jgi:hypothetical protein